MSSLQLKAVLLHISSELSSEQLEKLKFLCGDVVGKKDMERISAGLQLFRLLEERGRLGVGNTDHLSELLAQIQRQDLSDKLGRFESQSGDTDNQPDEPERAKLDIATEVIVENLGKDWRKLGRKLGLKEVKLDSILRRHPTELDETVVELLKEWRKSNGAEARTEQLIRALRACQLNLTADKVEDRLKALGY